MTDNSSVLYIFKFSAIDTNGQNVNSYFLASSKDECELFLDVLGYKNLNVVPLKEGEEVPDYNKPLDLSEIAIDFSYLSSALTSGKPLLDSVIEMSRKSDTNKHIYERLAYFIYKGDTLTVSMQKLGTVIPKEIIDEISIGELAGDIPSHLASIIKKYGKAPKKKKKKKKIFGKEKKKIIEGIDIHDDTAKIAADYKAKMFPFKYTAVDENGKKVTGYFDAESIDDCTHFLEHSKFTKIHVEPRKSYDVQIVLNKKISLSSISFDLTQLSTYLKAGIPLVEAVDILSKQAKTAASKNAYSRLVYDLLKGDNLSTAMLHQGTVFPKLLINMVKSAEMTGDLSSVLDDMAAYYEDISQTKKEMKSAAVYPIFVLVLAIGVLVFMLVKIVPTFATLYETNGATLPDITLFVLNASDFFKTKWMYIVGTISIVAIIFTLCYKNIREFRKAMQSFAMHLPGIGKLIIYSEIYNFTKTFASLLNHGVFITDSMQILSNITDNEVYKDIIAKTLVNLAKGNSISESFKGEWAFPTVAYHMLVTGESTGQLGLMMEKVSEHYKQLHRTAIDQFKSMIEPVMILLVAVLVGIILISIVYPMFGIYEQIK